MKYVMYSNAKRFIVWHVNNDTLIIEDASEWCNSLREMLNNFISIGDNIEKNNFVYCSKVHPSMICVAIVKDEDFNIEYFREHHPELLL